MISKAQLFVTSLRFLCTSISISKQQNLSLVKRQLVKQTRE